MTVARTRNYVTIVYPESAPSDWQQKLAETCIPALISPLHEHDFNPDGEPKKAHYHVILMFAGVKTIDQVHAICKKFGGIRPQQCSNVQGYARYLVHKDNPEKYQYDPDQVVSLSGADWYEIVKTNKDRYDTLDDIVHFIMEKHCFSYSDLVNHSRLTNRIWFEICCDNTIFLKNFCKSAEWTFLQRKAQHNALLKPHTVPNRPAEHNQES